MLTECDIVYVTSNFFGKISGEFESNSCFTQWILQRLFIQTYS